MPIESYVALFFVVLGSGMSALAGWSWLRARASTHWPSVPGVIEEGSVEDYRNTSRAGSSTAYDLRLRYRYTVRGCTYHSTRRGFGRPDFKSRGDALRELALLGEGVPLSVYHHPGNPALAVLQPGVGAGVYRLSVFAGAMLATGLWLLVIQ